MARHGLSVLARCGIVLLCMVTGPVLGAGQAERAVGLVKKMVASGEVAPGTVLKLAVKQGNITAYLGQGGELKSEWERQTGIQIDARVIPQIDSLEFLRSATGVDLTIARNHEYPDLYADGLIEDLTPLLARFGFVLDENPASGFILLRQQANFTDRVVAVPADGDVALLYLRRDLLEDPAQRARFRTRHGRELAAPKTWREYDELVRFFHDPKAEFYGSLEPRERLTGWMYWMLRYASLAAPGQYLFDERMRPLIDSPAGVAAAEHYVASVESSPPGILEEGRDYSFTLPLFMRGRGFATVITVAGAKILGQESSLVRDKFVVVPMPGSRLGGRLHRRTILIYGNNLVVPATAPNKALAFLYAMWLTDPAISARSIGVPGGFTDPYRHNHFTDKRIQGIYSAAALESMRAELPLTMPAGTGLPGEAEYVAALNDNLLLAAQKKITPQEAMSRTAREWEVVTERRGRARQMEYWSVFRRLFPHTEQSAR